MTQGIDLRLSPPLREENLKGRKPNWKTTLMGDNLKGRQPQRRGPQRKMPSKDASNILKLLTNFILHNYPQHELSLAQLSPSLFSFFSKWKTTTNFIFVLAFYSPFFSTLVPLDKMTSGKQRFC